MKRLILMHRNYAIALLLVLQMGVFALACSQNGNTPIPVQTTPQASLTLVDVGEGSVTVQATWVSPGHFNEMPQDAFKGYSQDQYTFVHVSLDTHSVDLSRYDMSSLASLSDGSGSQVQAAAWISLSDSGHHRSGVIAFSGMSNQDWAGKYKTARFTIKDVAGVPERVLSWDF